MTDKRLTALLSAAVVAVALFATACSGLFDGDEDGSGELTRVPHDVASFRSIDIGSAFDADVTVGPGEESSVTVVTDENLHDLVAVGVRDDTLVVAVKDNTSIRPTELRVIISAPALDRVEASGASDVAVEGTMTNDPRLDAAGASRIVARAEASTVVATASGASTVEISGNASMVDARALGASTIDASGLHAEEAAARAEGASRISVHASGAVTGTASGASTVVVSGGGTAQVDTSGASSVEVR